METNTQGLGRRTSHRIFLWRRPSKTAQPEETPAPAERHQENQETTTPLSRRALVPLKEVYFVGIGAADWLLEQAITVERNLAKRGQRRNETLSRVASQMGASVSDKTSAMSKRGRERVQQLGEKLGDKMQSLGAEQEMPEGQPST